MLSDLCCIALWVQHSRIGVQLRSDMIVAVTLMRSAVDLKALRYTRAARHELS